MARSRPGAALERLLRISFWLKAADGLLETAGGAWLLARPRTVNRFVLAVTRPELAEDPRDLIATHLVSWAHRLSANAKLLAAAYLLVHGLVKLIISAGVLSRRPGVYPWAQGALASFAGYELYRFALARSSAFAFSAAFDAALVALLQAERHRYP